jgi:3D (Asp-Asp-Asp) domain-containing protein
MEATAFARARQPTSSGTVAHEGIVAADPAVLPLGTRIRITGTEAYNGVYLVTDTGSKIKGRHIDLYVPTRAEAKKFGKKTVRVQVLRVGKGKEDARNKDATSAHHRRNGHRALAALNSGYGLS